MSVAEAMVDASPDGLLLVDQDGTVLSANRAMHELSGYAPDELIGQPVERLLPVEARLPHQELVRDYFSEPQARRMGPVRQFELLRKDHSLVTVDIALGQAQLMGRACAVVLVRDMTAYRQLQEQLEHEASHDALTGLGNRRLFSRVLAQRCASLGRELHPMALLVLDLDGFKLVNDSFGHVVGDALLVEVARCLRRTLRADDQLARLGGDEFAVLLTDIHSHADAARVAEKMLLALSAVHQVEGYDVMVGASIGIAFYPDDARDADNLLRYADFAAYQAKAAGRGGYVTYSSQVHTQVSDKLLLQGKLKKAMEQNLLSLHYQPQVDVHTGQVVGVEALLRWEDPELGMVAPGYVIAVAELSDLILPLGEWILDTACRQIAAWARCGRPVRVAINLSVHQLRHKDFPDRVRQVLQRHGVSAQWLEFEITESQAMPNHRFIEPQLHALAALGACIVLDGFGTGYASVAYLKQLPLHKLKIHRTFVENLVTDEVSAILVKFILMLAQALRLELVAGGVETDAQLSFLREHKCATCQGWLFSSAVPAAQIDSMLTEAHAW
ncbi:EAL domain-containing protein [Ramlibacter sp. 2FC]|uniref:putative bifunctional diguanylate cyclase/phosphodiesterase n=1 Tax=Ramlibacter sp. 2FC TaxID=2502188 RepID=UPI001485B356|nr:EAL domain-containing protein [Ramlibacter sp. 2FC]